MIPVGESGSLQQQWLEQTVHRRLSQVNTGKGNHTTSKNAASPPKFRRQ